MASLPWSPSGKTSINFLKRVCLAICPVMVPPVSSKLPQTRAMYFRCTVWSKNCFANLTAANSDFASTIKPLVFLSMRWTNPKRGSLDSSKSGRCCFKCQATPLINVPLKFPAPGWTTIPAGLLITKTWSSSNTMFSGSSSAMIS